MAETSRPFKASQQFQMDSDSEVEEAIAPKAGGSRATSQQRGELSKPTKPTRAIRVTRSRFQKKSTLFLESDEDGNTVNGESQMDVDDEEVPQLPTVEDNDDEALEATIRSHPRSQDAKSMSARKKTVAPADDSDDELAFQGFGDQRAGRSR